MVNAARAEAALGDLEAATFAEQQIAHRHAHVLQPHFHVAVRRVVVAEHRQRAHHLDALGVRGHDDHRLLRVAWRVGVGLAHHDVDRAARVTRAGGPPLGAVDHVLVTVALDAALDVGGIRRSHSRLGHQKGRADLAAQQRLHPAVLDGFAGVALQRFHVAGVGCRAVEDLGRERHPTHDFTQRCVLQIGQALRCAGTAGQEQVPQARSEGLGLELFDNLGGDPRIAVFPVLGNFRVEARFVRVDVLIHEREQALAHGLDFVGVVELHGVSLVCLGLGRSGLAGEAPRHLGQRPGARGG